ncbi:Asparagine synthetase, partial [Cymbomonas tetramitiformis]
WLDLDYIPDNEMDLAGLRQTVVDAVVKRLMSDVPYGVLLSGGLDSSLVSSIAARHMSEATESLQWSKKLHSFSIGIKGAPDLQGARMVADFLGTQHHEFHFTPEEALDALPDVVYHLESYEQVRASVPMYLLSRKIKSMGVKMVLSGEGADETLGGYLYFHQAPDREEYHRECVRKTTRLHQWDVLRANKSTQAWGVEARCPFLDKAFLEAVMNLDPSVKMIDMEHKPDGVNPKMEKWVLRKAFDTPEDPYLPESILWRQKEQFSDGVGYDWVDGLKEHAEKEVTDAELANAAERFPDNPPETKEYYLLRSIFEEHFPERCGLETVPVGKSIACSTPEAVSWNPEWEKSVGDISGRAVGVHVASGGFSVNQSAKEEHSLNGAGDEGKASELDMTTMSDLGMHVAHHPARRPHSVQERCSRALRHKSLSHLSARKSMIGVSVAKGPKSLQSQAPSSTARPLPAAASGKSCLMRLKASVAI